MNKNIIFAISILTGIFTYGQSNKEDSKVTNKKEKTIEEVVIQSSRSPKIVKKEGKYEVSVVGKDFQDTPSVWEGMKQIPLLSISEGAPIKVQGKVAIVEVNGIQLQMDSADLESYLKTLDPKNIKKITIDTTPDSSYGSEVYAVVNITLNQREGSYQIGANTTNGIRTKFYNSTGVNYGVSKSKFRLYTSYNFGYTPTHTQSEVQQIIADTPLLSVKAGGKFLQLSQTFKHEFNDDNTLKVGSHQVFNKGNSEILGTFNSLQTDYQKTNTITPIIIAFTDYTNKNKLGKTSVGIKFHNINVENKNQNVYQSFVLDAPFNYNEKVLASYINHSFSLSKGKSLRLGLRSETSYIDYTFTEGTKSYHNKNDYTNLLYDISYNWSSGSWDNNLTFRKQIFRPNYNYLNPFQRVSTDVTYTSGDSEIVPTKFFTLSYQTLKNKWAYFALAGYFKDFTSSFYDLENNRINSTYKNFENVYVGQLGTEYNNSFFNRKWTTKVSATLQYVKLNDTEYEKMISKSSASLILSTNNVITLSKTLKLNINYELTPTNKDGLLKHYTRQRLDLTLSKKINSNLNMMFFAYDIFKTDRVWHETTVPNYFYGNKSYGDMRAFGIILKWNITGKSYKRGNIEETTDNTIDRLK
ncbi:outer membrane beta-barrel protein [Riemerella anatipestifer]|uniref:outer membrane beta-barrel protein n=1 Tax=Riemerella anatipestifer TaxID=34085 RepID=UPI0035A9A9AC